MVGARVNGNLVNIDYKIKNGDQIDIITSQNSKALVEIGLILLKVLKLKTKLISGLRPS